MNIIMPQLGETVTEGTVTKWYKKVGDPIKADEVQRIRKAIDAKAGVYTIEEILKEHPLTAGVAPKAK